MRKWMVVAKIILLSAVFLLAQGCSGVRPATSEKPLMHVFAYTPVEGATEQDFQAFTAATRGLVGKIPGLKRVWVGKLKEPIAGETGAARYYGVAMEFENADALQVYATHPAHTEWVKVYEKVRVQGTTTLDILDE